MPIPLDLYAEVTDASGSCYRWDANQAPGSRLTNFTFRTKIGEGFSDSSGQLARRIDLDYPDLGLGDTVTLIGADGSIAYEGRQAALPRSIEESHTIGVTLAGWVAHTKDRKFREIYVDRDLGAWVDMSLGRRVALLAANFSLGDIGQSTDPTDSTAAVSTSVPSTWAAGFVPISEAWYDVGPGLAIGKAEISWKREGATIDPANTSWSWQAVSSSDDKQTSVETGSQLRAAGPAGLTFTPTVLRRYMALQFSFGSSPGGADGVRYAIAWYKLAVYGSHGLTTRAGQPGEPSGVLASDVIKHIASRYCPQLDTSGVRDTSYVIQHLAFRDRTYPYDAFLEINKFHQWHLGVWENKRLDFRPYDLTDYDWEVRTDDPGTIIDLSGPSTEDLFNGIVVVYKDLLTGTEGELTPLTNPELGSSDPGNAWNQQGIGRWDEITVTTPCLAADATQIGRMALAERSIAKTPGTITVRGYIRDRQGNPQPVWKVRAGDTLAITNYPNDRPRLIVETSYDDSRKQVSISVDRPFATIDSYFDRFANALQAGGLG